ncbi:MAG TPA: PaaI family thioesterase [Kofleriaceae bacterium]|nr:PaaI family thioesterase [Kofleriaceae bacterium]
MPRLTLTELEAVLDEHSPRWRKHARILGLGVQDIHVTMPLGAELVRAGGTFSGPALMALADRAAYYLTLALVGPVPDAVTSNLAIHFLVRPQPGDITATATVLRIGSRLVVSSVEMHAAEQLVAHATVTYALPQAYTS